MKLFVGCLGFLFLFITFHANLYSQSEKDKAMELGVEAVKLMDGGDIDKAINLLKKAKKLDPDNYAFPYEIGYAYYLKKDYKKSVEYYRETTKYKNNNDQCFQMLGNILDIMGKTDEAICAYDEGLKVFPNSGRLYLEKGNIYVSRQNYDSAIIMYEKGTNVAPSYPSNYFNLAKIFCSSTEEVWGLIYDELFMNLERNSKRTIEMSKLLYDTYKKEIKFESDTNISVSFSKSSIYGTLVFEPIFALSLLGEKSINLNSLDRIRSNFVKLYYEKEWNKKHPNILFEYHKQINDSGHLESYNHWLFMQGDENQFNDWHENNEKSWDSFVEWFTNNPLQIDDSNKFIRPY